MRRCQNLDVGLFQNISTPSHRSLLFAIRLPASLSVHLSLPSCNQCNHQVSQYYCNATTLVTRMPKPNLPVQQFCEIFEESKLLLAIPPKDIIFVLFSININMKCQITMPSHQQRQSTTGPATRSSAQPPLGCRTNPHLEPHCPPPLHLACPFPPHSPHMIGSPHQLCHPKPPPTQGAITLPLIVLTMINHQHCKPPGKFIINCTFLSLSYYCPVTSNIRQTSLTTHLGSNLSLPQVSQQCA